MEASAHRPQTLKEEIANSLTHGIGILFSVVAISLLVTFSVLNGSAIHVVSSSIFAGSFLLLYTFSTLYHAFQHEQVKRLLRTFDHISIYILISGTYTPFLLLGVGGALGWVFFGIIWLLAVLGIIFKVYYQYRFPKASLIFYLGMGWMGVFLIKPLFASLDATVLSLILGGGVSYTLGTIFFVQKKMMYAHAIWHLFVLGGTITHFIAMMFLLQV
jgi:hemolysin III